MKLSELISQMEESNSENAAHITIDGVHEYYLNISSLKAKKNQNSEVVVFVVDAQYIAPKKQKLGNKKALYNMGGR